MDLDIFRVDVEKESEGVWTEITFRGKTGKFKIARAGNAKFNRVYTKLKLARNFADPESEEAIEYQNDCLNRAFAEAILIDTGDEITNKGKKVKYTPELGYTLMTDPGLIELKNQIAQAAGDFEQYAIAKLDELEEK